MSYSFFGTCANDHTQLYECLETIIKQTILPREIILVDSGEENIKSNLQKIIIDLPIKLIYLKIVLPRSKALNIALDKSTSDYTFRFDTRSRFEKNYSEKVLQTFHDKSINAGVVGGTPMVLSENESFESKLCAEIMKRDYVFFFPKHRKKEYLGYASSVYLGCFKTNLLKEIRFRDKLNLISEDSLIINDFSQKGYKTFISPEIKISYICRSSLINLLKLFNTYGYCRMNSILISKKIFLSSRHFFVCSFILILITLLINHSYFYLLLLPSFLFLFNIFGELLSLKKGKSFIIIFCSTLCQFSWILGFLWRILTILKNVKTKSNFIS